MTKEEIAIVWTGGILLVLALGAVLVTLIWAGNHYGNQLAKECIQKGHEWVLVDRGFSQWECRK